MLALFQLAACGLWKPEFSAPVGVRADAACSAVATSRASDAGMTGEDENTQREVFERTYSSCHAWRLAHEG